MARKHTKSTTIPRRPCKPLPAAIRKALLSQRRSAPVAAGLAAVGLTLNSTVALAAVFPAELELSSLLPASGGDGSSGFVLNGIDAGDISGRSVSDAGDVNGDGIDDVIVGADRADPGGRSYAGESYVVFGRDQAGGGFPAELELSSLQAANGGDGSSGFVLNGIDVSGPVPQSVQPDRQRSRRRPELQWRRGPAGSRHLPQPVQPAAGAERADAINGCPDPAGARPSAPRLVVPILRRAVTGI